MSKLYSAVNTDNALTDNGAVTNLTSHDKNVDLFFIAGASRGKDITPQFAAAFGENPELAVRIIQHLRDVREGAGERETFRKLFAYLITLDVDLARRVLVKIPELGRFDDLYTAFNTPLERDALRIISHALMVDRNGLCAKWCQRNGPNANKVRAYMKLTPKQYRRLVVDLTNVVETKMCAQQWTEINYEQVPSMASARYQKAFGKHDSEGYGKYIEALKSGEAKINAGAIYPYDVIKSLKEGNSSVAIAQWDALPNYMEGSTENILPLVDVSGSMSCIVSGTTSALDMAVSLGLYTSERMSGEFKNQFITFSEVPQMIKLSGNLKTRYDSLVKSKWGYSTNLVAVFDLILDAAKKYNIPQNEMPTKLLVLSDMQFNVAFQDSKNTNVYTVIENKFKSSGYEVPQIIYWNLNAKAGNNPVTAGTHGTALVSGASPSIMKSILSAEDMSPLNVMLKTLLVPRYDF